jgi:hypothetical protein
MIGEVGARSGTRSSAASRLPFFEKCAHFPYFFANQASGGDVYSSCPGECFAGVQA